MKKKKRRAASSGQATFSLSLSLSLVLVPRAGPRKGGGPRPRSLAAHLPSGCSFLNEDLFPFIMVAVLSYTRTVFRFFFFLVLPKDAINGALQPTTVRASGRAPASLAAALGQAHEGPLGRGVAVVVGVASALGLPLETRAQLARQAFFCLRPCDDD